MADETKADADETKADADDAKRYHMPHNAKGHKQMPAWVPKRPNKPERPELVSEVGAPSRPRAAVRCASGCPSTSMVLGPGSVVEGGLSPKTRGGNARSPRAGTGAPGPARRPRSWSRSTRI